MKHVFIVNPAAGKHRAGEMSDFIIETFDKPVIVTTEYPGHATELAREYAGEDVAIYSLGGDGTFNEVVNGVMTSDYSATTIVADVPCGSGNDFIKGFTDEKDPYKLLASYRNMNHQKVDVGLINGRYFVNISSVGFDAEIVFNAKKYKRLPLVSAELAYVVSVFATLIRLSGYKMTVQIDRQEPMDVNVLFATMANGNYYGGGMKAAPKAIHDDGLLDFGLVDIVKRRKVPFLLPKYMKGKHDQLKEVHMIRGEKMTIHANKPLPVNIDGEVVHSDDIQVSVIKGGLNVLLPSL
jgi:YegS/Rv2252/BmrU family lipid kinase